MNSKPQRNVLCAVCDKRFVTRKEQDPEFPKQQGVCPSCVNHYIQLSGDSVARKVRYS